MALTPTMHFEGKSDEGLKAITNSNLRKQRVIPDGKLVYADSTNLPLELPSDTLLFTTDTRELYIGTGKSIKRVNLGNDGEIIDKTDYLTKVEAARYYVQKETLNPESVVRKVDLENSLNTINTLINQLSERADKTDDDIQNVIRNSNDKFVTNTKHEQDLIKKVSSEHLTPTGNHCFVINDTIGPTLKYQNTANNKESSINVGKDKITINFSNTDGDKVGSKLYINSNGIYYTNSNDDNFEQVDEILTKKYTSSIEGKVEEVKSSIDSIREFSNNALSKATEAEEKAEEAKSNIDTAVSAANTAVDTANSALGKAETVINNLQTALDKSTEALTKANEASENSTSALNIASNVSSSLNEVNSRINNTVTLATNASKDANDAKIDAAEAKETANELNTSINNIDQKATEAKNTANSIKDTADSAKSMASSASTIASNASTLVSTLNDRVDTFTESINNANKNANDSLTIANESKGIASDAKILAQEAKSSTISIEENINEINTKLNALSNYDDSDLQTRVGSLETTVATLSSGLSGDIDLTELSTIANTAKTTAEEVSNKAETLETRIRALEDAPVPEQYDDSTLKDRITALEERTDNDTIYDDTDIKARIEALEAKEDKDTIYDDIDIKNAISSINSAITTLQNKEDKDTIYDDTEIKERIKAIEDSNYETRVSSLETTVATLSSGLTGEIDLTEVSTTANEAKTTAENAMSEAESLKTRVETLEAKEDKDTIYDDTDIKARIEALENASPSESYDDTAIKSRLDALESKEDKDTVYDDTDIKARIKALEDAPASESYDDTDLKNRITALENKTDNDTIYDDTDIKARIKALEDAPAPEQYDDAALRNRVETLENKEDKDTVYDDTDIKARVKALEDAPTVEAYDDTVIKSRLDALEAKEDQDTVYDDTELKNRVSELETKTAEIATLKSQIAALTKALNDHINNGSSGSGESGGNDDPPDPGTSDQYEWTEYFRVGTNVPKIVGFQQKIGHTVTNEDVMGVWDEDNEELMLEAPTVELRYLGTTKDTNLATEVLTILTEDQIHDTTFMNQNILSEYPEGKKVPTVYDSEEEIQAFYNDSTTNGAIDYEDTSNGILVFTRSVVANQVYMIRKKKS